MNTTKHFRTRVKNRLGFKKKNANSYLKKAIENGLYISDTYCRPTFNKYLNNLVKDDKCDLIVYNRHIIIFSKESKVAITVLELPNKFYSTIESLKRQEV